MFFQSPVVFVVLKEYAKIINLLNENLFIYVFISSDETRDCGCGGPEKPSKQERCCQLETSLTFVRQQIAAL